AQEPIRSLRSRACSVRFATPAPYTFRVNLNTTDLSRDERVLKLDLGKTSAGCLRQHGLAHFSEPSRLIPERCEAVAVNRRSARAMKLARQHAQTTTR